MPSKHPYEDILHIPRPVSSFRHPMPIANRAAQFAPFAALTGHSDAVLETARLTENRSDLDNHSIDALNLKLQFILSRGTNHQEITVTYFQPDLRKSGGAYIQTTGHIKKIDPYARALIMSDQTIIPIEQIFALDCDLFDTFL